jgi:tetratricopeptide (TPR) repeat protein
MLPGLIAFAVATLGEFSSSIAAEIGKKKTLSFLEEQGKPIINHHLARALIRALSGSLIERLNAWCETPEGKQNKDYALFAIKQLKAISNETNKKNEDWTAFLEKFNNNEKLDSTVLNQSLETIRVRYKQPMQVPDLKKKAIESLRGYYSDPVKNQKALSNFCEFVGQEDGATFNRNFYERFREEIKKDPVTFNDFTIDFLSQIYADVESAFPNADALAYTLSSFAASFDKIEAKIDVMPEKAVELLTGVLMTKEDYRESLKETYEKIVEEYRSSSMTGEQGEQILKMLEEIQFLLSNPQVLEESYHAKIKQLEEQIAHMQALKEVFPEQLLEEAIVSLREGNDQKALEVFQQVDKLTEASIVVAAESKFQQGLIEEQKVQYGAALELVVRACELVPNNPSYLNITGNFYSLLGAYDKAIGHHEQALAIRQAVLPSNHPDIAASLNNLGRVWYYKSNYDKAIGYHEQALAIRQAVLPSNHPDIAESLNNLGNVWNNKGNYDKAIGYQEQALAIRQAVLPSNHPDIAASLNNLGNVWYYKGDCDKAIGYYERALAIKQEVFPSNHPDIAASLNNLGIAWYYKGDCDKAIGYYERALAIKQAVFPSNHLDIAASLNNLGNVWNYKGDCDKAIGYYEQALAIKQEVLPPNHLDIATSLNNLGVAWHFKGDYDKEIGYYEQALAINQEVLPSNHPDIATSLNNLGNVWDNKGDYDKAIGCHEKALAIRQAVLPSNHPDIAVSLNNLGITWYHKGDYDKAIGCHEKALAIKQAVLPSNHLDIALSLNNLGNAWDAKGDYEKAIGYHEKALAINPALRTANHPQSNVP